MKTENKDKLLSVLKSQVGVREVPKNSNRGPEVEKYQNFVGAWLVGGPWCAAFVSWCMAQVYNVSPVGKQSSAIQGFWTRAADKVNLFMRFTPEDVKTGKQTLEVGDIFVCCSDDSKTESVQKGLIKAHTGHVGFVVGPNTSEGKFPTTEGNTDPSGSREGGGVYARTRNLSDKNLVGFVRVKE